MKPLLRPSWVSLCVAALTGVAVWLVLRPEATTGRAVPLPLPEGDQELVWLYPATNAANWQRLVTAAGRAASRLNAERPEFGLTVEESAAFPAQSTAVPELVFMTAGCPARLRLRWYKLTSDRNTPNWIDALLRRQPPPLAILGGGSSDLAIEMLQGLQTRTAELHTDAPLAVLTMATADESRGAGGTSVPLHQLYQGKTFRFCFTNRQMARAVTAFLWTQDDLRPDSDPAYLTFWEDDPYSVDLADRFYEALRLPATSAVVREWAWLGNFSVTGGLPISGDSVAAGRFRLALTPLPQRIPYSIGGFSRPNRWEEDAAHELVEQLAQRPWQQHPLLVLPATSQPARRFLHGLQRSSPRLPGRFIVATGDAIALNTVYRDRELTWPIQDLPYSLVFFCHRNPVDAQAGFVAEGEGGQATDPNQGAASTGTEDLLLYLDCVAGLVQAAYHDGQLCSKPDVLAERLRRATINETGGVCFDASKTEHGRPLFDDFGNRRNGTGEHVVCLRPVIEGGTVAPRATIEVWSWQCGHDMHDRWLLARPPLPVSYEDWAGP